VDKSEWKWYGNAGHNIVSSRCRFHLTTEVGKYFVSTVGEFFVNDTDKEPDTVGLDRLYESMVFEVGGHCPCGCGLPLIKGNEVDFEPSQTPAEATANHMKLCEKWGNKL
jgi:hypothetical protein